MGTREIANFLSLISVPWRMETWILISPFHLGPTLLLGWSVPIGSALWRILLFDDLSIHNVSCHPIKSTKISCSYLSLCWCIIWNMHTAVKYKSCLKFNLYVDSSKKCILFVVFVFSLLNHCINFTNHKSYIADCQSDKTLQLYTVFSRTCWVATSGRFCSSIQNIDD